MYRKTHRPALLATSAPHAPRFRDNSVNKMLSNTADSNSEPEAVLKKSELDVLFQQFQTLVDKQNALVDRQNALEIKQAQQQRDVEVIKVAQTPCN